MRKWFVAVALIAFFAPSASFSQAKNGKSGVYEQLNLFGEAFNRIRQEAVEPVADGKLVETAITGMLAGLDPHSSYLSETEYNSLKQPGGDEAASPGLVLTLDNGQLKVVSPRDGTPAAKAGVKPGDIIFTIDKEPTYDLTLSEAEQKLRGRAGTTSWSVRGHASIRTKAAAGSPKRRTPRSAPRHRVDRTSLDHDVADRKAWARCGGHDEAVEPGSGESDGQEFAGRLQARLTRDVDDVDFALIEIGGTVGDIESLPFLEAIRQLGNELGAAQTMFVHLTLVPYIPSAGELKTKPTQHSVAALRSIGLQPDALVCRLDRPLPDALKRKIALMCDVDDEAVVGAPDAASIYDIPKVLHREGLDAYVVRRLGLAFRDVDWTEWDTLLHRVHHPSNHVTIAIVGKYVDLPDAYLSVVESLNHAGFALGAMPMVFMPAVTVALRLP